MGEAGHGPLGGPWDFAVGHRWGRGVRGLEGELGIWLSGIGGGGGSWDISNEKVLQLGTLDEHV